MSVGYHRGIFGEFSVHSFEIESYVLGTAFFPADLGDFVICQP